MVTGSPALSFAKAFGAPLRGRYSAAGVGS